MSRLDLKTRDLPFPANMKYHEPSLTKLYAGEEGDIQCKLCNRINQAIIEEELGEKVIVCKCGEVIKTGEILDI